MEKQVRALANLENIYFVHTSKSVKRIKEAADIRPLSDNGNLHSI